MSGDILSGKTALWGTNPYVVYLHVYQGEGQRVYAAPPIHFKGTGAGHGIPDLDQGTCLPGLSFQRQVGRNGGEGISMETLAYERGCSVLYSMCEDLVFANIAPWPARCERRGAARSGQEADKPSGCALRRANSRWETACKRRRQGVALEAAACVAAQCLGREGSLDDLHSILT